MKKDLHEKKGPNRGLQAVGVAFGTVLSVLLLGSTAYATAPAGTGAEDTIDDGFGKLTTLVTGTLGLALFGIVVAVLGITMGVRWLRKGASS